MVKASPAVTPKTKRAPQQLCTKCSVKITASSVRAAKANIISPACKISRIDELTTAVAFLRKKVSSLTLRLLRQGRETARVLFCGAGDDDVDDTNPENQQPPSFDTLSTQEILALPLDSLTEKLLKDAINVEPSSVKRKAAIDAAAKTDRREVAKKRVREGVEVVTVPGRSRMMMGKIECVSQPVVYEDPVEVMMKRASDEAKAREAAFQVLLWSYLVMLSFTDEKIFTSDFGKIFAYAMKHEERPVQIVAGRTAMSKMCWMMIHAEGIIGPIWIDGNVNTVTYINTVCAALADSDPNLIKRLRFQQDNASSHKLDLLKKVLEKKHNISQLIDGLEVTSECLPRCFGSLLFGWPPNSPDLSIIENLWHIMNCRKTYRGRAITLKQMMTEITQSVLGDPFSKDKGAATREDMKRILKSLFESYPRRLLSCIEADGARFDTMDFESYEKLFALLEAEVSRIMKIYPEGICGYDIYVSSHCLSDKARAEHYKKQFAHLWELRGKKFDETKKIPTYITERIDELPWYVVDKDKRLSFIYDLQEWLQERVTDCAKRGVAIPDGLTKRVEACTKTIELATTTVLTKPLKKP